ncbi:MAG: hypothetical protein JWN92_2070, partial [Candidatus Acidoferrum typicum]|nr:hypothetical protein [Candidatus Acidoferrum typicum]
DANAIITVRATAAGSIAGLRRGEMVGVEVFDFSNVGGFSREMVSTRVAAV